MTVLRKLKISPSKSDGAVILFGIQGYETNFSNTKPITISIAQDACYDVIVVCSGNAGNKASVTLEAIHKDFEVFLCTPSGTPSWTGIKKLEAIIPNGESAWLTASVISVRRKADKPGE